MFINLQTPVEIFLLILGLAVFGLLIWRRLDWGAALVLFCSPLYLLKIKVGWLPLTVLEVLILTFFVVWLIKKVKAGAPLDSFRDFKREIFCSTQHLPSSSPPQLRRGGIKISFRNCWKFWLPVALILAGAFSATIWSLDVKTSAGIFKSWILEPIVFGFLLLDIIKTQEQFKNVLLSLILSGAAVAAISLGYLFAGQLTFDGRLKAFYLSPNHLAMFLAPAFIMALGFWFWAKKLWQKTSLLLVACLLFIVLYFTYSYAAWLAMAVAAMFLLVGFYRSGIISRKNLYLVSGFLVIVFILTIFLQFHTEKLSNLLNSERSSWQSRLMVWQAALKIGQDHWFLGIGPGLFQKYYLDYQKYFPVPYLEWAAPQPHNLFLAWWLQAGILGLAGFGWLLINFFRWTVGAMKKTKQPLVIILMAVMVYVLIHGLLDTTYWKNDLALIFWAVIALSYAAGLLKRE